jgi:hypothetical protein
VPAQLGGRGTPYKLRRIKNRKRKLPLPFLIHLPPSLLQRTLKKRINKPTRASPDFATTTCHMRVYRCGRQQATNDPQNRYRESTLIEGKIL